MRVGQGVQTEVLVSLALVMLTGTGLFAAVFLEINHARVEALHGLLGRGFVSATRDPVFEERPPDSALWWRLDRDGRVSGLNVSADRIDPDTEALGHEVLLGGEPMVSSGAPWSPIRFAAPRPHAPGVVVGRVDAPVSGWMLGLLVATDVLIFGLFGVTLMRRRIVGPLHRLSTAVRVLADGELRERVPEEGAAEIEQLGGAFNEMQARLAGRTDALEKAVVELRDANASLLQAREGLDRAERMAMVGSLAAGVAHEVGNPMAALLAFLDVAARDANLGDEGRRCLTRASEQGERVRVILRQLLDFSRAPQIAHAAIDLEGVARQAIELVSAQTRYSDIVFTVEAEDDLPRAFGDAGLSAQILLNLVVNAAAAIEGASVRRIDLQLRRAYRRSRAGEENEAARASRPSDMVVCEVADSGPGIGDGEPERLFDPFFTTKAPGEGTGLGLANARRLAEEMGGRLEVDPNGSALGGALFKLTLPTKPAEDRASRNARVRGGELAPIGPERF